MVLLRGCLSGQLGSAARSLEAGEKVAEGLVARQNSPDKMVFYEPVCGQGLSWRKFRIRALTVCVKTALLLASSGLVGGVRL